MRVQQRELMGERYRTVLGHFRHEAGHYFYPYIVPDLAAFTATFGDPNANYESAMQSYYDSGPFRGWERSYVSAYASSHPLEDWAECFAHYLHIQDTLETAVQQGQIPEPGEHIQDKLWAWMKFSVQLNELCRALGLRDAYPFVLTPTIRTKLEFVDAAVAAAGGSGG